MEEFEDGRSSGFEDFEPDILRFFSPGILKVS
jgi:hypothetical protein